jgi:hypothetical protein
VACCPTSFASPLARICSTADLSLIRTSVLLTLSCLYVMWALTYLAQMNPLIGEWNGRLVEKAPPSSDQGSGVLPRGTAVVLSLLSLFPPNPQQGPLANDSAPDGRSQGDIDAARASPAFQFSTTIAMYSDRV